jgi:hypothetical protein
LADSASPVSDSEPGSGGRTPSEVAAAYFERVAGAFLSASGRNGTRELTYGLGGETFRLRFAGETLPPLMTPALEHLRCSSFRSGLTVNLWDAPSTGVDLPGPPWNRGDQYGNGGVRGFEEGRYRACVDLSAGLCSLFDAERQEAFVWLSDPASLPAYVVAAPLRVIFHWWTDGHDGQLAHAAAVGTDRGGVLLAGAGGAGKSTTAFACLRGGLRYAGDDYVLIEPRPAPRVTCLYNSGKLEARNMAERFPELLDRVHNADAVGRGNDKGLVFVHQHWPEAVSAGFPVAALLVPRLTGQLETRLVPCSPAAGLKALLPHSVFPLPGARAASIERLGALVRSVPGYYLEIGADLLDVPAVIQNLLNGEAACLPPR